MTIRTSPLALAAGALAGLSLAGCSPPAPEPTPAPPSTRPVARPAPTPSSAPASYAATWMDAPQTPGDWQYARTAQGSIARFGSRQSEPQFSLACDRAARSVTLIRAGRAAAAVPMRILTESRERLLDAQPMGDQLPEVGVSLPANDPILDAMAFSKGRFAVETAGLGTIYVPSWPEVTRVIEDCRS